MVMDREQEGGAISFSLDGELLGVAFTGLREQLSRAGFGAASGNHRNSSLINLI